MMTVARFEVHTGETDRDSFVPIAVVATAGITYEPGPDDDRCRYLVVPVTENIDPDQLSATAFEPADGSPAA